MGSLWQQGKGCKRHVHQLKSRTGSWGWGREVVCRHEGGKGSGRCWSAGRVRDRLACCLGCCSPEQIGGCDFGCLGVKHIHLREHSVGHQHHVLGLGLRTQTQALKTQTCQCLLLRLNGQAGWPEGVVDCPFVPTKPYLHALNYPLLASGLVAPACMW